MSIKNFSVSYPETGQNVYGIIYNKTTDEYVSGEQTYIVTEELDKKYVVELIDTTNWENIISISNLTQEGPAYTYTPNSPLIVKANAPIEQYNSFENNVLRLYLRDMFTGHEDRYFTILGSDDNIEYTEILVINSTNISTFPTIWVTYLGTGCPIISIPHTYQYYKFVPTFIQESGYDTLWVMEINVSFNITTTIPDIKIFSLGGLPVDISQIYQPFIEHNIIKGLYNYDLNLVFTDGEYLINTYITSGASADPVTDIGSLKSQISEYKFDMLKQDLPTTEEEKAKFDLLGVDGSIYHPIGLSNLKNSYVWQWRLGIVSTGGENAIEIITPDFGKDIAHKTSKVIDSPVTVLPYPSAGNAHGPSNYPLDIFNGKLLVQKDGKLALSKNTLTDAADILNLTIDSFEEIYPTYKFFKLSGNLYVIDGSVFKKYNLITKEFDNFLDTTLDINKLKYFQYQNGKMYFFYDDLLLLPEYRDAEILDNTAGLTFGISNPPGNFEYGAWWTTTGVATPDNFVKINVSNSFTNWPYVGAIIHPNSINFYTGTLEYGKYTSTLHGSNDDITYNPIGTFTTDNIEIDGWKIMYTCPTTGDYAYYKITFEPTSIDVTDPALIYSIQMMSSVESLQPVTQYVYSFDGIIFERAAIFTITDNYIPASYFYDYSWNPLNCVLTGGTGRDVKALYLNYNTPEILQIFNNTFTTWEVGILGNNSFSEGNLAFYTIYTLTSYKRLTICKECVIGWSVELGTNKTFDCSQSSRIISNEDLNTTMIFGKPGYYGNNVLFTTYNFNIYEYGYLPRVDFKENTLIFDSESFGGTGEATFIVNPEVSPLTSASLSKNIDLSTSVKSNLPLTFSTEVGTQTGKIKNISSIDRSYISILEVDTEPGIKAVASFEVPFDFDINNCIINVIGSYDGWDSISDHHIDVKLYNFLTNEYEYTSTPIEIESMDSRLIYSSTFDSKFVRNDGVVFVKFEHERGNGEPLVPGHELKIEKIEIVVSKLPQPTQQAEYWSFN